MHMVKDHRNKHILKSGIIPELPVHLFLQKAGTPLVLKHVKKLQQNINEVVPSKPMTDQLVFLVSNRVLLLFLPSTTCKFLALARTIHHSGKSWAGELQAATVG